MARIEDLPLWLRAVLKIYPWRRVDPVPFGRRQLFPVLAEDQDVGASGKRPDQPFRR